MPDVMRTALASPDPRQPLDQLVGLTKAERVQPQLARQLLARDARPRSAFPKPTVRELQRSKDIVQHASGASAGGDAVQCEGRARRESSPDRPQGRIQGLTHLGDIEIVIREVELVPEHVDGRPLPCAEEAVEDGQSETSLIRRGRDLNPGTASLARQRTCPWTTMNGTSGAPPALPHLCIACPGRCASRCGR